MTIQSTFGSFAATLSRNPLPWALVAGITAKATQIAICSFFRASPRLISLMARASHVSGGSALVNYGPSLLIALATGVLLHYCSPSIKPTISAAEPQEPFVYETIHARVDHQIQEDALKEGRSLITVYRGECRTAYTCSNYPKRLVEAHTIFCDAFGYAHNDLVQVAAIADGCGVGEASQRAARFMVDHFMYNMQSCQGPAEKCVMGVVKRSQDEIEATKENKVRLYGKTTFLGGLIFTATNGKRYFTGVNCGDCKLYHLNNGKFVELTKPSRTDMRDSGGNFGPNRKNRDKTEYTFTCEVQPGDKLIFMTDGVHDNLDSNPSRDSTLAQPEETDHRKLSTLHRLPQTGEIGSNIMDYVFKYTEPLLTAMENNLDPKNIPGKPDHMTLLVVQVR
ncbi:MAG TPA: PP2C family serine/threonine-protein phosphatase [Rhabdochlamydiaceae bacterium]|jgi:serine/threonine protein phosphatase PrpC|nr:PP2C family serine/threonine-protein phosphatase [Rhabdochlamydiaceae bacterium]